MTPDPRSVVAAFDGWALEPDRRRYLAYSAPRYAHLLEIVDRLGSAGHGGDGMRILDVGPYLQTHLLRERCPGATVNTLGFEWSVLEGIRPREGERHIEFDLNDAANPERWPKQEPHDLVVMAEVIEHLYTAPEAVLRFVAGWLAPKGVVILQTPNAAALHKRLRLLAGRNPVEPIRPSRANPGHFHEYTAREIRAAASEAGLEVSAWTARNYFDTGGPGGRVYMALGPMLPPSLRHGLTFSLVRAPSGT